MAIIVHDNYAYYAAYNIRIIDILLFYNKACPIDDEGIKPVFTDEANQDYS